ncbi:hypothetical protein BU15DRAFT_77042 [Melanogaster broomeanus]|nr:hypothetical protein BU15DRAFT_77042 [Melanogaster broomeanus]
MSPQSRTPFVWSWLDMSQPLYNARSQLRQMRNDAKAPTLEVEELFRTVESLLARMRELSTKYYAERHSYEQPWISRVLPYLANPDNERAFASFQHMHSEILNECQELVRKVDELQSLADSAVAKSSDGAPSEITLVSKQELAGRVSSWAASCADATARQNTAKVAKKSSSRRTSSGNATSSQTIAVPVEQTSGHHERRRHRATESVPSTANPRSVPVDTGLPTARGTTISSGGRSITTDENGTTITMPGGKVVFTDRRGGSRITMPDGRLISMDHNGLRITMPADRVISVPGDRAIPRTNHGGTRTYMDSSGNVVNISEGHTGSFTIDDMGNTGTSKGLTVNVGGNDNHGSLIFRRG